MTLYDATSEFEFCIHAEDSYEAMEKLQQNIENGEVSPKDIAISEQEHDD